MWVATDQNHVNDSLTKVFKVLLKSNATVVTYNGATAAGRKNRDSVYLALANLGFNSYDTLDRNFYGSTDLDYSPWWTIIYVSGDPNVPVVAVQPTGQSGLSFKETEEMEKYLKSGLSYAKKSVIMAGQNIAFQNGFAKPNNNVTDTEFFNSYMHTKYVANSPVSGAYSGLITGMQTDYWNFKDQITSASPDVVKPAVVTPLVGPEVNWYAYTYNSHALTPADSGAATTYYNPLINTVFFGFDWSDATHTAPYPTTTDRALYSGVTRVMRGALDFIQSHAGTILPVEFVRATGTRSITGTSAQLNWETAQQHDVARFDVEMHTGATWTNVGSVSASKYSFTHDGIDASATYVYRIVAVDQSGAKTYSTEINVAPLAASGYSIEQNYPNPTSGVTSVRFTLPVDAPSVTLRILDVTGKVVTTAFANEPMSAGNQSKTLDVTELPSGSYIYELTAVDGNGQAVTLSKKMTLNK